MHGVDYNNIGVPQPVSYASAIAQGVQGWTHNLTSVGSNPAGCIGLALRTTFGKQLTVRYLFSFRVYWNNLTY